MNTSGNEAVRTEMMRRADLVSAVRLPNNLFKDSANTEVGSDLIILQKHSGKQALTADEERFCRSVKTEGDYNTNAYFLEHDERIVRTSERLDTDPYGRPAMVYRHDGGAEGIAADMRRMLADDLDRHLNMGRYLHPTQAEQQAQPVGEEPTAQEMAEIGDMMLESDRRLWEERPPQPEDFGQQEQTPAQTAPASESPILTLYDLFGFTEEERRQAEELRRAEEQAQAPKAVQRLLRHGFEDLGLQAAWCGYYDGDTQSKLVQEKCGFQYSHTEYGKISPLGDVRTEHFTRLGRADWIRTEC